MALQIVRIGASRERYIPVNRNRVARRWLGGGFRCQRAVRGHNAGPHWQLATATTARHAALATRFAGFIGRPLVRGALLMRGATTLAGDLTLLLGGHRCEASTFFARFVHGALPSRLVFARVVPPPRPSN